MDNKKFEVKIRDIIDTLPPEHKKVYKYIPEILLEEKTYEEVAELTEMKYAEVIDIYENFLHDVWSTGDDNIIAAVVSRLEKQSQTRLLVESFKATKKFGKMWSGCVDNLSKLEELVTHKVDALMQLKEDGEEISDRELSRLIDMSGKHQKHVTAMMESSPLVKNVSKGGGFNITLNNTLPDAPEKPIPEKEEVIVTEGYVEPPDL